MKLIRFQGGLGNQLFQYAFLRNLEIIHYCDSVKGDFSFYGDSDIDRDLYIEKDGVKVPNIMKLNINKIKASVEEINEVHLIKHQKNNKNPMNFYCRIKNYCNKIFNNKFYCAFGFTYVEIKNILHCEYFVGFWQSWRYTNEIEKELRNEITLKDKYSDKTQQVINELKKENAVFIGIRRGDYLITKEDFAFRGSFSSDYYNKAIHYIKERVKNPVFYIFSDDIPWVKENMNFEVPVNYREKEDQTNDVEELFIMGACKHAIIVNSTFQWWGAWLIDNKDKIVIAPDPWFNDGSPIDIIPPEWHQMERC